MKWNYHEPIFEYEEKFQDSSWPWSGHKRFAYDLIRNLKPEKIVELGTHKGTSFFSLCQGIKDENLDAEVYAIDTWKGDEHAGLYGDEVFDEVKKVLETYYDDVQTKLLRKTFDAAVNDFDEESIDLLHIDGLHTYDAVKHDFETWLPRMKKNGIILFHDINVGEDDFGVYKLWSELKERYTTKEFLFSHGLGILFLSEDNVWESDEKFAMHYAYAHEINRSIAIINLNASEESLRKLTHQKNEEIKILKKEARISNQKIEQMKSSKFWKLREKYLSIKKSFSIQNN